MDNRLRAEPNRVHFTKKRLEAIIPGKSRTLYYPEQSKLKGLVLAVGAAPGGKKVFYFYGWDKAEQKPLKLALGEFPRDLDLIAAEEKLNTLTQQLRKGLDPKASMSWRDAPTFGLIFEKFMDEHVRVHRRPKTVQGYESISKTHLSPLLGRKAAEIKKSDVRAVLKKIRDRASERSDGKQSGDYAANRTLALIRAVYNWARANDIFEGRNPTEGIKKFRESPRQRHLGEEQLDEQKRLIKAIGDHPEDIQLYYLLLMFTAVRPGNAQTLRWKDLELGPGGLARRWIVPVTKNHRPYEILLPDFIYLRLLKWKDSQVDRLWEAEKQKRKTAKNYKRKREDQEVLPPAFVFIGRWADRPMKEPRKTWNKIRAKAGLDNF